MGIGGGNTSRSRSVKEETTLPEILGRFTDMPVANARHETTIEPNHVYVCPSDHVVTIEDGRLLLEARLSDVQRKPIDVFLGSLAEAKGENAVGIVLSGGGSDGAIGIKAIKERGGLISCRNLLIYLGAELRARVIPIFHFALRPSGYLFLGASENISQHSDLFQRIDKKQRLFQRRDRSLVPCSITRACRASAAGRFATCTPRPTAPRSRCGPSA
jgi:CheB methylesterase/CheR methyltransferase, SAM binding domain